MGYHRCIAFGLPGEPRPGRRSPGSSSSSAARTGRPGATIPSRGSLPAGRYGYNPALQDLADPAFNRTHATNPAVDALLDKAAATLDEGGRLDLYHQAEPIAASEAAVLPLWQNLTPTMKKPWVSDQVLLDPQWRQPFDAVSPAVLPLYLPLVVKGDQRRRPSL